MSKKKIPQILRLLLACSLVLLFCFSEIRNVKAEKIPPSVLLITIDTLRKDRLPFYGYEKDTAPFLNRLASQGTVFTNAYSTSSWTVPSLVSLMTGVYPYSHGITRGSIKNRHVCEQRPVPSELPNLPEQLKALGYRTYAVTTNEHLAQEFGFGRGFDQYTCIGFKSAEEVNRTLLNWKKDLESQERPVFIWLHYFDPHIPYKSWEPWLHKHQSDETEEESRIISSASRPTQLRKIIKEKGDRILTLAKSHYDSEINYCDTQIANLFHEFPILEKYAIFFTSDHGEEFLEHGKLGHARNLYNETVRIPLFISVPGIARPTASTDAMASIIDVAPTIVTVAGGSVPASWQGTTLIDRNGKASASQEERYLLAHLNFDIHLPLDALISSHWKLIINDKTKAQELYHTKDDSKEQRNLMKLPSKKNKQPDEAFRMKETFWKLRASLPPPPKPEAKKALQKEQEEALRSLGYVH